MTNYVIFPNKDELINYDIHDVLHNKLINYGIYDVLHNKLINYGIYVRFSNKDELKDELMELEG
jgi:hypothetical protein